MAVDLGGSAAEEAMEERGYGRMGVFEEAAEAAEAAEDAEDAVGNAVQHGNAHNRTKQSNTECNRVRQRRTYQDSSPQAGWAAPTISYIDICPVIIGKGLDK